jgi:molybdopterin-guanine dinucleotide biosynthesis protein A
MQPFSAIVLAAGRSTRMGRDKAQLDVAGQPLWQRQRDVLARAGASEVFLSARPDQTWSRDAKGFSAIVHDAMPGCGPIVGITAGLERAAHPFLAVVAVDLPAISSGWFESLVGECESGCGVVGQRGDHFEPLAAVYPRGIMWLAWEALVHADYSLQRLLIRAEKEGLMRVRDIKPAEEPLFVNWNEEKDRT